MIGALATGVVLFAALVVGCASRPQTSPPASASASELTTLQLEEPYRSALARINHYRAMANLPPIVVDPALSDGAAKHSRYIIKNQLQAAHWYVSDGRLGAGQWNSLGRSESEHNQWYTREGASAARYATILMGPSMPANGASVIDQIMAMPFNTVNGLNPQLSAAGYGAFCEHGECASTAAYRPGLTKDAFLRLYEGTDMARWNPALGLVPPTQARLRAPILFPPPNSQSQLVAYEGNGWPDPFTSCPGYEAPSGPAIVLALGKGTGPHEVTATEHSFSNSKQPLESCLIDAASYRNPDAFEQQTGRLELTGLGAVILIPRAPLVPGERYNVSITADGKPYAWSFTVRDPIIAPRPAVEPAAASARAHDGAWLARVNYYRAMLGLGPVSENPALSKADLDHARYMAKNRVSTHRQDPANQWYTAAGDRAARQSNVWWGYGPRNPGSPAAVDFWIEAPFHRLSLLNPNLRVAGFAHHTEGGSHAAALNAYAEPPGKPLAKPLIFPPPNSTVELFMLNGEMPNPLTSCAGYRDPSGLPVTLALGQGVPIRVTAHSFTSGGTTLEHCVFDATSYRNPDAHQQQLARSILGQFGAVVLVPRDPLHAGARYDVSITVGGQTYAWSFTVAASPSATPLQRTTLVSPPATDALPAAPVPDWLSQINLYRAMARISPAAEDAALSDACIKHARYVRETQGDALRTASNLGPAGRREDPGNPWFSEEGSQVAPNVDLAWGCGVQSAQQNIDRSMASVFHRFALLDPKLTVAGVGGYEKDGCWVVATRLPVPTGPPEIFPDPVEFPPAGSTTSLEQLSGEWPDPLSTCRDYGAPAGLPFTIQFGRLIDAQLAAHSILENGKPLDHCAFDAVSYQNPDAFGQEYGRWALKRFGAVALIPRTPLTPGAKYDVSITTRRGKVFAWSFSTAETADVNASDR